MPTSFNQICFSLKMNQYLSDCARTLQEQGMKSPSAVSNQWGSYFVDMHRSDGEDDEAQKLTWCCHCIHKYSTMAIPSVEHIAGLRQESWGGSAHQSKNWNKNSKNLVHVSSKCPSLMRTTWSCCCNSTSTGNEVAVFVDGEIWRRQNT